MNGGWRIVDGARRYSMFPIRHSLFIPPIRAWHIRQLGVDWPARRHYYLLDTHAWSPIVLAKPRLVLVFAGLICITLASTPHGAQPRRPRWPRMLCAHGQNFSSARHRQSGCGEREGKRPRRAGLFQEMRGERRQSRGRRHPRLRRRTCFQVRQDQAAERARRVAGVAAVLRSTKSPRRRASSAQS